MISVNELRIGNLLEYAGKTVHVTKISLDIDDEYQPIIGFCRMGEHANEQGGLLESITELRPIPLTPEWFGRFKFGQLEDEYDDIKVWSKSLIEVALKEGKFYLHTSCTDPYYNQCIGEPLAYVNQLQNLFFALMGEELIIEV